MKNIKTYLGKYKRLIFHLFSLKYIRQIKAKIALFCEGYNVC